MNLLYGLLALLYFCCNCPCLAFAKSPSYSSLHKNVAVVQGPSEINMPEKEWTFIVYMAADNDLRRFAHENLAQMVEVGSSDLCNIVVDLHTRLRNSTKVSRQYFVEKNQLVRINQKTTEQPKDSGDYRTLIDNYTSLAQQFPARNYGLILWNHGSGVEEPGKGQGPVINTSQLFVLNPVTNKLEIDRSIPFFDLLSIRDLSHRALCWDDRTGNFISNAELKIALSSITQYGLNGKRLAIFGCDTCLSSMFEIACIAKDYADYMVSSQELEPGTGWNYSYILEPLAHINISPKQLAQHIVESYNRAYQSITDDYTLSAIDLSLMHNLEDNVNQVAHLLHQSIIEQLSSSVKQAIRNSIHKTNCIHFANPNYKDLYTIYSNLLANLSKFNFREAHAGVQLVSQLTQLLEQGKYIIERAIIANAVGNSLKQARGISIYCPDSRVHSSYHNLFAQNHWANFLSHYLLR